MGVLWKKKRTLSYKFMELWLVVPVFILWAGVRKVILEAASSRRSTLATFRYRKVPSTCGYHREKKKGYNSPPVF